MRLVKYTQKGGFSVAPNNRRLLQAGELSAPPEYA